MPRFCATEGSTRTVAAPSSPAYFGTRSMSMKGDLPGRSNFTSGRMGSYQ
jgi:hypothetical protein